MVASRINCPDCGKKLTPGAFEVKGEGNEEEYPSSGTGFLWTCSICDEHYCGYCLEPIHVYIPEGDPEKIKMGKRKIKTTVADDHGDSETSIETEDFIIVSPKCGDCGEPLGIPYNHRTNHLRVKLADAQNISTMSKVIVMFYIVFLGIGSAENFIPDHMVVGIILGLIGLGLLVGWIGGFLYMRMIAKKMNSYVSHTIAPGGRIEVRASYDLDEQILIAMDPPQSMRYASRIKVRLQ